MEFYANLHMHTTHSDGVYTPEEIVRVAKAEGYSALAISDHDTATGYPRFKAACEKEGIEPLFAVEFSVYSEAKSKSYHIVAFSFDPTYPPMAEYLAAMGKRQTDNTKSCFDEAVATGGLTGITWEEVEAYNEGVIWLCNNHVFAAMKAKGLVKEEDYMDFFLTHFQKQRGKYPPTIKFKTPEELVALVKAAGGFCVVAHPHNQLDDIDYLIELGIEGMEVWHPDLTEEEKVRAHKIALEKGLFISGGCDHSGLCGGLYSSYHTEEELKASYHYIPEHSVGTTEEYFRELQNHKLNR